MTSDPFPTLGRWIPIRPIPAAPGPAPGYPPPNRLWADPVPRPAPPGPAPVYPRRRQTVDALVRRLVRAYGHRAAIDTQLTAREAELVRRLAALTGGSHA